MFSHFAKTEKRWMIAIAAIVIFLSTAPLVFGYLISGDEEYYAGMRFLAPGDYPVYYSFLEQVKRGDWMLKNLYTSENDGAGVFNIFWLGAGLFGKMFHLPPIITFQLLRILFIPVLIVSLYAILSHFVSEIRWRKIFFLFLVFSSGVGAWLGKALYPFMYMREGYYHWPMDLWVAESNTLLTAFHSPHFIASLILFLWILFLFLLSQETGKRKYSAAAGLLALILFQFHPYHAPTIYGIVALFLILQSILEKKIAWAKIQHGLILIFLSLPSVLYYVWLIFFDPYFLGKAQQNYQLMTVWWMTIISYGFVFVFSIIGFFALARLKKYREKKFLFLLAWFFAQGVILHLPLHFGRRLTEGWQIPMSLLAGFGLYYASRWLREKFQSTWSRALLSNEYLFFFIFIIFFSFSNVYNSIQDYENYAGNRRFLFYLPSDRMHAMEWIKINTPKESVVLSSRSNGLFLPAWSVRKVFLGHRDETTFVDKKEPAVFWFFSGENTDIGYGTRQEFLKQFGIDYIFWTPSEASFGTFRPENEEYLELAYQSREASVYRIR